MPFPVPVRSLAPAPSPLSLLSKDVATIVRASARQLRDKSPKTRVGVFGVLRQLVAVRPGDMAGQVDALAPGLLAALNVGAGGCGGLERWWDKGTGAGIGRRTIVGTLTCGRTSFHRRRGAVWTIFWSKLYPSVQRIRVHQSALPLIQDRVAELTWPRRIGACHQPQDKSGNTALKIEALSFLRQLMAATPPAVLQPHTKQLAGAVFACVNERYYKVGAGAGGPPKRVR